MPEGDTIHRVARRVDAALVGRAIEMAQAPDPRSPLHTRAAELEGRRLERAEARGKHLLLHFSGDAVVHSHLGMNGRWRIASDGMPARGRQWLLLSSGSSVAAQSGGKILRLISETRARNDPTLMRLGPDPLGPGFDDAAAAGRLCRYESTERVGVALLDQSLIAGIGNVIRIEACFLARVSPWRRVADLAEDEALELIKHVRWIMETSLREGERPRQIYRREARRAGCPRCGSRIESRGQGDDNRVTLWCPGCQR